MGINVHFLDNTSYGAEDFRQMFARLTSQGVSLYKDTGTLIEDVQEAMVAYTHPGVGAYNNDSCKVTVSGGVYMVSEGVIWLYDGTSIGVDGDGHELEVTIGAIQYVYAEPQAILNSAAIVVSTIAGGTNTVPLATIAANGTITDTRVFAATKVAPGAGNLYLERTVSGIQINIYTSLTLDFGWTGFTKITCRRKGLGSSTLTAADFSRGDDSMRIFDPSTPNGFRYVNIVKNGHLVTLSRRSENMSPDEDYVFEVM